ncbi:MAG: hypothetical protein ACQEVA_09975 [Myxococcota bacterium]
MKKPAAILAFSLLTMASATAFACPPSGGPLETAAMIGMFTSVFWLPLAMLTSLVLFLLRKRFNSRRGLVFSMLGSLPFSAASVIGMLYLASELLQPAMRDHTLIYASVIGCVTALNAGYVTLCHQLGRKDR